MSSSPGRAAPYDAARDGPSPRAVFRVVAIVVLSVMALYVADLQQAFDENEQLRELDENYDITGKLGDLSDEVIAKLGDTAGALVSLGSGLISATFALVTLVLSMFTVASGRHWLDAALARRPPREAEATRRAIDRMAGAVSGYVGGALLGVIGALLAIPTAAVIQVAAYEYLSYRRDAQLELGGPPALAPPAPE